MVCLKGGPKAPVTATKRLASGGGDHMVRVWRLVSHVQIYTMYKYMHNKSMSIDVLFV